ncbi:hypothetical protein EMIT0111MI5_50084 [Burkholderia sp. IT-111MI5]
MDRAGAVRRRAAHRALRRRKRRPHAERRLPPQGLPDQRADLRVRRGARRHRDRRPRAVLPGRRAGSARPGQAAHGPLRAPAGARCAARAGLRPRDERRGRGRNGSARSRHPREAGLPEPVPVSRPHDAQRRDAPARLPAVDRRRAAADGRRARGIARAYDARLGRPAGPLAVRLWLADLEPGVADRRRRARQGARLPSRALPVVAREPRHARTSGPRAGARSRRLVLGHRVPALGPDRAAAPRDAVEARDADGFVPARVAAVLARERRTRERARVRDAPRRADLYGQAVRLRREGSVRLRGRPLRHDARLREPHGRRAARERHPRSRAGRAARAMPVTQRDARLAAARNRAPCAFERGSCR